MKRVYPAKIKKPKKKRILKRMAKAKRSAERQVHRLRELRQRQMDEAIDRAHRIHQERMDELERQARRLLDAPIEIIVEPTAVHVPTVWIELSEWIPPTTTSTINW